MYARETAAPKEVDKDAYESVDEKTVEWLKAQVAERRQARKSGQLHPELIGRS
ncbi:MAG: hypothetical protein QOG54_715 [Actinomycetota bacterium]|jgi:hypothetical protein|nr:hypothetical protein [Actinomycetota bacterium]